MAALSQDVQILVRQGRAAVREALARSGPSKAWTLLQERDPEGNPRGARPYTDEALAEFEAAYAGDPDNTCLAHHLAIAHHARAWDMEVRGDPRAAHEWERALGCWRVVAASGEFWANLKDKLLACDPDADAAWLTQARQDLLENVMDVHVDFVRHYCEGNAPERATIHVEIVKRASLPPAVKKRLVAKVCDAMTSAVPAAKAAREFASALTSIERFLALFLEYLPALRMYVEVCKECLSAMSYQRDWDDISCLGERAEPHARRMAALPELVDDPLSRNALEELACEFARCGLERGDHFTAGKAESLGPAERDAARGAYEFGIRWGRLGHPHSPSGSQLGMICAACLNNLAASLHYEAIEVWESDTDPRTKLAAVSNLYRQAVADLEEAISYNPGDEALATNLEALSKNLAAAEAQATGLEAKSWFNLFGNLGG